MLNRIYTLGLAVLMASSLSLGVAQSESRVPPTNGSATVPSFRDMGRAAEMHTKMAEFHTSMANWHRTNPGATLEQARAEMERLRESMGLRGPRERGERPHSAPVR
jgi:hypothetical protein